MNLPRRIASFASATAWLLLSASCNDSSEFSVNVVSPVEGPASFATASKATLWLFPQQDKVEVSAVGSQFAAKLSTTGPDQRHQVEAYLRDATGLVLGWGTTSVFRPDDGDPTILLGLPGKLATATTPLQWQPTFGASLGDEDQRLLLLASDGQCAIYDPITQTIVPAPALVPTPGTTLPGPDDGILIPGLTAGTVIRLAWNERPVAYFFSLQDNAWSEIRIPNSGLVPALTGRPGAAHVIDYAQKVIYILGGEGHTDWLQLNLLNVPTSVITYPGAEGALDSSRAGADAFFMTQPGNGPTKTVLFGTQDPALPLVYGISGETVSTATVPEQTTWTGASCQALNPPRATAGSAVTMCVGGLKNGEPTADAAILTWIEGGTGPSSFSVEIAPNYFPSPVGDVVWLADTQNVYAQADGVVYTIQREQYSAQPPAASPASRFAGGTSVPSSNGATFLLGGVGANGLPNTVVQYFRPIISWDID